MITDTVEITYESLGKERAQSITRPTWLSRLSWEDTIDAILDNISRGDHAYIHPQFQVESFVPPAYKEWPHHISDCALDVDHKGLCRQKINLVDEYLKRQPDLSEPPATQVKHTEPLTAIDILRAAEDLRTALPRENYYSPKEVARWFGDAPKLPQQRTDDTFINAPQPSPINPPITQAVWPLVIADMRKRNDAGIAKYGMPLALNNGRDPLIDAYQEALDLVVYLRQAIEERNTNAR